MLFAELLGKLTKLEKKMEYQLEIYGPGGYNKEDCIKVFTSSAPFLPLHAGDLLNTSVWGPAGSTLLQVLNVEHVIIEKSSEGIDPSGKFVHRALIYTKKVVDSAQTRQEPNMDSFLKG
jgi:hypothetical protein